MAKHTLKILRWNICGGHFKTFCTKGLNTARRMLFTHGRGSMESITRTRKALIQNIPRVLLYVSMWNHCLKKKRTYYNLLVGAGESLMDIISHFSVI